MASRVPAAPAAKRVRLAAADRRASIVEAATRIALREGLEHVTLRSLGDELGVTGSLVSHYFPSVDDLLAEAFAAAAGDEVADVLAAAEAAGSPIAALGTALAFAVGEARADVNRLWIDAWHVARRRPALQAEVVRQTDRWTTGIAALITDGVATGAFRLDEGADARDVAARIMAVVDGLTVQSTLRGTIGYDAVARLGFAVAERELGLEPGALIT